MYAYTYEGKGYVLLLPIYLSKQGLALILDLVNSARLVDQQAPKILLSSAAQCWDYRHVPGLDFAWVVKFQIHHLTFMWKSLY